MDRDCVAAFGVVHFCSAQLRLRTFYFGVLVMEIDTTFIGKTMVHHLLIIFFPLLLILLICAIIIALLQGVIKNSIISLILRFSILAVGAFVWVALLPLLTKIALS